MLSLALVLQLAAPPARPAPDSAGLAVRLAPDTALVERDPATGVGYANFDLLITRDRATAQPHELVSVVMTARDPAGALVLRRFCDTSGLTPCIRTVPDRTLDPGATVIVYNPFHELPARLPLRELRYVLSFADTAGTVVDSVVTVVPLRDYPTRTELVLPLRGRVLVFDGHDFYAHHRRWNLAHPVVGKLFRHNAGRYAYDLSIVDSAGHCIRATAAGTRTGTAGTRRCGRPARVRWWPRSRGSRTGRWAAPACRTAWCSPARWRSTATTW